MQFTWNWQKEIQNRSKHKVSFSEASSVFSDRYMLTLHDTEHSQSEDRWITVAISVRQRVLVVVHTHRLVGSKEYVRIISARKATRMEAQRYSDRRK